MATEQHRNVPMRLTGPTTLILRSKIQAAALITRISKIAHGEIEGDPALLSVQVRAALGLLNKALPDLQQVRLDGEMQGKLVIEHRVVYPDGYKARVINADTQPLAGGANG